MPCDQVRVTTLDFRVANTDILKTALEAIGYSVITERNGLRFYNSATGLSGTYAKGSDKLKLSAPRYENVAGYASAIAKAYSGQVVKAGLIKTGWKVTQNGDKMVAERVSY